MGLADDELGLGRVERRDRNIALQLEAGSASAFIVRVRYGGRKQEIRGKEGGGGAYCGLECVKGCFEVGFAFRSRGWELDGE